jgi:deazaflavin-dependent oxidoreductase (nitroreductase family)
MAGWNEKIIEEFRANAGRVGGPFEGASLLLLTTTGARSGRRRTTPVVYLDDGDRLVVFASNAGADRHPDWYHNLIAHPEVTVEVGDGTAIGTRTVTARPLAGEERDRVYARQAALVPTFADYQAGTSRVIPVIALYGRERSRALGDELVRIHDGLRRELAEILAEAESGALPAATGRRLRDHCLMFCKTLHAHHANETDRGFPLLERRFPELGPVLERLRREHDALARIRQDIEETLAGSGDALPELRRLATELEAHFRREEEQLVDALNAL